MTALVAPLHTGTINGQPVRFFKGPSGQPELPWHAVEDLYQALGLPRAVRRQMLQATQRTWGRALLTVATADGIVTIAPHPVAIGLLGAVAELRTVGARVPAEANLEREYVRAGGDAAQVLTRDLPPEAALAFALAAGRNTYGPGSTP